MTKRIVFTQTEPLNLTTIGIHKSMPKINLVSKVEEISEVKERKTFSEKLNMLFSEAEEVIQDNEMEELPLPNHEQITKELNKSKILLQLHFFHRFLSQSFETKVRQIEIYQASWEFLNLFVNSYVKGKG